VAIAVVDHRAAARRRRQNENHQTVSGHVAGISKNRAFVHVNEHKDL
jgi:hypothetical protein